MPLGKLGIFMCYYVFVIMHELSHIVVALLLKVDIKEIVLLPIGVNAKYDEKISGVKEFVISLAGPLASFLFAILFKDIKFVFMNISVAIFNLIPIYPLDGGKILRNFFAILFGKKKGRKLAYIVTKIFITLLLLISIILVAYFKNYYALLLGICIYSIAKEELEKEQFYRIINYLQTY